MWLVYGFVFEVITAVAASGTLVGRPFRRLVMLEFGSVTQTLALVCLAEGYDRDVYFELALVFAFMSFVGNLVFVRLLERWL
jgi:multicomponent Na+:H+ antiporter subunit F